MLVSGVQVLAIREEDRFVLCRRFTHRLAKLGTVEEFGVSRLYEHGPVVEL